MMKRAEVGRRWPLETKSTSPMGVPAITLVFVGVSFSYGLLGCDTSITCSDTATCPPEGPGDAASDTGLESGADGSTCDPTKTPSEAPCLIDEQFGVFVSPRGNDSGMGTKAAPYKTLAKALGAAHAAMNAVYACDDGSGFNEQLVIDATLDGVRLYGGFRCTDWSYSTARRAIVRAPSTTAVKINQLTTGVLIQDFSFRAADAMAKGDNSVGLFVSESHGVRLSRVTITAGMALGGESPVAITSPAGVGAPGNKGNDACQIAQGPPGATTGCGGETSGGGAGGPGANTTGQNGGNGIDGSSAPLVASPLGQGGKGEGAAGSLTPWSCASVETGLGQIGAAGIDGASGIGAITNATLDAMGCRSTAGIPGKDGHIGQGGGGGGGAKAPSVCGDAASPTGASGGSAGAGGCGGKGGGGGGSGGSSIAVASFNSDLSLDACDLVAANAGNGGNGAAGQRGGIGGDGGRGGMGAGTSRNACSGGKGGDGGNGGAGGGGAGGHSLGIAYVGTKPMVNGGMTTVGTAGLGGNDGAGQITGPGAGAAGKAQPILEIK